MVYLIRSFQQTLTVYDSFLSEQLFLTDPFLHCLHSPSQGDVPSLGLVPFQHDHPRKWHDGANGNFRGTSLLLSHVQVSSGFRRAVLPVDTASKDSVPKSGFYHVMLTCDHECKPFSPLTLPRRNLHSLRSFCTNGCRIGVEAFPVSVKLLHHGVDPARTEVAEAEAVIIGVAPATS